MKKTMKKLLCLALVLSMLLSLGACFEGTNQDAAPSEPAAEPTAGTVTDPAAETVEEPKYVDESGIPLDTAMMTVGGQVISWSELRYWLLSYVKYVEQTLGTLDWAYDVGGADVTDYVTQESLAALKLYTAIAIKSEELGITLSPEDAEYIASLRATNIENLGSEEAYNAYLEESWLTEELYTYLIKVSSLYYGLFENAYGENGALCSDEETLAYGEENGYLRAKHILILTQDTSGNKLTDAEVKAAQEKAEGILSELKSASDPVSKFDELAELYNEDPGKAAYPDGYQFVSGDMVEEFETAVLALDDYEYSDIVTTDYGYHIIMRLPLEPDEAAISDTYGYSLRYNAASYAFDIVISGWASELDLEYLEAYDKLNLEEIFIKK